MSSEERKKYKYLFDINSPEDLRKIPEKELPIVCEEVREFLIDTITKIGGHFGGGLGAVEMIVALHYVFETPTDKLIFDVGHQAYPHKILTGRRDLLHTIRQKGGLSGFLKPSESIYDVFGAGHASTSISAGLGIAAARDLLNESFRVVSIIGDGSMTGGLAFEAMNNCGVQQRDMTVVLNDNDVSISSNVSALSNYFNEIYASGTVQKLRDNIWDLTGKMDEFGDRLRKLASRFEEGVKAIITPGVLFEAFGFKYFGPIDGNNIKKLVKMFRLVKDVHGPIFLHLMTKKGKGYQPAEEDEFHLHAIDKIDKETGKSLIIPVNKPLNPRYQDVFGNALTEICRINSNIVGITAAMADGTGIDILQREFPERVFDVGIAEGHAVTFSAGLAKQGIIPVVAIYSTFLQRAYDHIIHDCALQKLHVVFCLDRAGLVGNDGPTHHGTLDFAYLRSIPNMTVMAPKDEQELRDMLFSSIFIYGQGPIAIRYPRGRGLGVELQPMKAIPLGKGEIIRKGNHIAIISIGKMVQESLLAADLLNNYEISVEIINARFVKPLDTELIDYLIEKFDKIVTIEDGQVSGGFGSAVLEYLSTKTDKKPTLYLHGIPDKFIEHGSQNELYHDLKLDSEGISSYILDLLDINPNKKEKNTLSYSEEI